MASEGGLMVVTTIHLSCTSPLMRPRCFIDALSFVGGNEDSVNAYFVTFKLINVGYFLYFLFFVFDLDLFETYRLSSF